jgi:hypothetical protein
MDYKVARSVAAISMIFWSSSASAILVCFYKDDGKEITLHEKPEGSILRSLQAGTFEFGCNGKPTGMHLPWCSRYSNSELSAGWHEVFEGGMSVGVTKLDHSQKKCSGGF